ncbi:DNA polymerase III subunit delta [Staphylococcus pseudintermedius]|uniref:DNA polymerase III subunit delta n=6 Tax=Staphylococcus pseudintermedius TaxID=283734 RepID=A0A317YR04_STAPS|nr:DNA polymerase III subunit delta [Staphylococcus pseudintermedius]ADV05883.1 DNA polymerase III delta subunit [Staphylococcus pseudintermedius HKU10-03]ANS89410.1 DNA polymerase III delta subunit [Staphylococcus pseudintermedius]ASQ50486.1 DNA polymerase III subunit delta [Staphylococcus pseudintermedius]EGQ0287068.1 DNA polymerase III subunit delta [Staphylococcus pseudintermedius]EGQ0292104.1 DNA polymerase III subunit delta [Staphylococcus pseudintermedius]
MSNIHVIHGEVPELIDRETEQLTQKYLGNEPKDDFNYVKYNLYETTLNTIIEEAMTLPFFSDKKIIVVQNSYIFTGEKPPKEAQTNADSLLEFIEKYDEASLIIFQVQAVKLDERKKVVKALKKVANIKKIEQMTEQEMQKWIHQYLNQSYKEIKQDALEALIQLTGIHYRMIKQELDKLLLFVGDRPTINKEDVQTIVNRSLEQNVFLLTDYIQKGQKAQAISLVKDLIQLKEEPIKLLALITSNYRLYYQSKILNQKGYSGQQIAKTVGVHPYRVKLALNQARKYDLDTLLTIMDVCTETDYQLKSSYMDKVLILELFIMKL